MIDSITVFYDGMGVLIYKEVAEYCNIKQGQTLFKDQFWEILRKNNEFGILQCQIELSK